MSNKKCRKADGLKYVTNRIKNNPDLIQVKPDMSVLNKYPISECKIILDVNDIFKEQLTSIAKVLKSQKPVKSTLKPLMGATYVKKRRV